MGRGGQLYSFEAVFSPKGSDGSPRQLWNRQSGAVDPKVADSWRRYDIRLILERNWPKLGPKLAGKLHIYMGAEDTFYLEGATRLLGESLKKLGSDAVVEIVPYLADRDESVRRAAFTVLLGLPGENARAVARAALDDIAVSADPLRNRPGILAVPGAVAVMTAVMAELPRSM